MPLRPIGRGAHALACLPRCHIACPTRYQQNCLRPRQAAWEKLHTGSWQHVPPAWRDAYALACLARAACALSAPALAGQALEQPRSVGPVRTQGAGLTGAAQPAGAVTTLTEGACALAPPPLPCEGSHAGSQGAGNPDPDPSPAAERAALAAALRECDLALLMGGPRLRAAVLDAVAALQQRWAALSQHSRAPEGNGRQASGVPHGSELGHVHAAKRLRSELPAEGTAQGQGAGVAAGAAASAGDARLGGAAAGSGSPDLAAGAGVGERKLGWGDLEGTLDLGSLPEGSLPEGRRPAQEALPSLERFVGAYMCAAGGGAPVLITGDQLDLCWSQLQSWKHADSSEPFVLEG